MSTDKEVAGTPTPAALQRLTERLAATDERLAGKAQQIMKRLEQEASK